VELRYLLYFKTVAEQQSFTRAAEKLRIAQPAISQQIKTLEEELQVKLLVRTKRSVKLTAAGDAFLRQAKEILDRVEQSRVEARRAAQGETGTLSIGFFKTGSFLFLPDLIHAYRTQYPAVRIQLHEQTPSEQLDSLELGRIDVGFTFALPKIKSGRFVQELLYRDCIVAVLPDRHALACSQKISLEKLANENWVILNRSKAPELVDGFRLLCKSACFSPRVVNDPGSMQTVLAMVAAGIGVSLAPGCISRFYHHRLAFIPIQPNPLDLVAARPDGDPSPTVAAFLDMLRQHLPQIRRKCAYRRPRCSRLTQVPPAGQQRISI
jgi:DNA-binding transcriptional LysR family regulator